MKFVSKLQVAGAILAVASSISLATVPAQASTSVTAPSRTSVLDCRPLTQQNAPFCHPGREIAVFKHGFQLVGRTRVECYVAQNLDGVDHKVAAVVLGFKSQQTRYIRSGARKSLCVVLPAHGCPRVNLRQRTGSGYINFGTYPSCGVHWRPANTHRSQFLLCATNHAAVRQSLQLWHHGVLRRRVSAAPGQRVCVTHSYADHWSQLLQVLWKRQGVAIQAKNILLSAYIWRA